MKKILIDLDDRCARDLERVAPATRRLRAEFVRLAIRRAIDLALDRTTEEAYRAKPLPEACSGAICSAGTLTTRSRDQPRPQRAHTRAADARRAPRDA